MEEIIDVEQLQELPILEGNIIPADFTVKLFDSLNDLTSYIKAFSIESGEWLRGHSNGKVVYQLSYRRM